MRFGIRTLSDCHFSGKTVLCRVDINQPVDRETGVLLDSSRIRACVPTLRELAEGGARVVVLAHQGSDIEYENFYTTRPHRAVLSQLLGREVQFVEDVCGPAAQAAIAALQNGEILLLDNVRFMAEEQTLFERHLHLTHPQQAQTLVVRKLAPLAELYVCDAFAAAHRDQPSLCGFEQVLPSAMGRLFETEYCVLSELMEAPRRPCVFVLGGAKISDAFLMMSAALGQGIADQVLTGGLVGNLLLAAKGVDLGQASMDFIVKKGYADLIPTAKGLLDQYGSKILLPEDLAYVEAGTRRECAVADLPAPGGLVDIGSRTIARYEGLLAAASTVFVNGPMGVFEQRESESGTQAVWTALAETKAYTVVGGGDSVTACNQYRVSEQIDYICTGGGALIRFLTGEELPVVKALRHGAQLPL
ncbi:MAG: phosphoglycerate kinase [Oscillibacter sp.]